MGPTALKKEEYIGFKGVRREAILTVCRFINNGQS